MTREERALRNLKQMCSDGRYLGSGSYAPSEVLEDFNLAIKALEQELTTENELGVELISREQALNEFCIYNPYDSIGVDKVRSCLKVLPTVIPQEPRWILVSESLPESDEEYHTFLVTDNKGRVRLSEFYLSISDKKPYWSGMIDVIAWMPLPKPYEPQESENT